MTAVRSAPPRAARFLESILLWNIALHFVAMAAMVLLLLPAVPGGSVADDATRVAYIAQHPWLWRLGWLPWQLTALADLLLGVALIRTAWIPRGAAIVTALLTALAILPDQIGQALWITRGVTLAQQAMQTGDLQPYLAFERVVFPLVAAWGCLGYLLGALGWTYCFAKAGTWSRGLTWLSVAAWGAFGGSVALMLLPPSLQPPPAVAAAGNAVAFVLLQAWLIGVTEKVLRRSRLAFQPPALPGGTLGQQNAPSIGQPDNPQPSSFPHETPGIESAPSIERTPRQSQGLKCHDDWRSPDASLIGRIATLLANSRFARRVFDALPMFPLVSDITNVVYINYLVEADRLRPHVPPELDLQRLGPGGRYAAVSILTYRHGHCSPALPRGLRKIFFSPIQSNWRAYVTDSRTATPGVYFLTTVISSTPYALGCRWFTDGMPMHAPALATIRREGDTIEQHIDPGHSHSPDLHVLLRTTTAPPLPPPWSECFANWEEALAYLVPQNRAISAQPWYDQITQQEIELNIPLQDCVPLTGEVTSRSAAAIAGDASPLCFLVPQVRFRFYNVRTS